MFGLMDSLDDSKWEEKDVSTKSGNLQIFGLRHNRKQQCGMCEQRRLRSAWASAQSDQNFRCPHGGSLEPYTAKISADFTVVVVVVLLLYVHDKHLRSCRDGQLT